MMPRRKTPKLNKLPAALATPINVQPMKRPEPWESFSEKVDQKWNEREKLERAMYATTEAMRKLPLLYQHYGIDQDSVGAGDALAIKLAIDYVPGFQIKEKVKAGRKINWHIVLLAALWVDVQTLIETKKCTERSACNMLLKKEYWKNALRKGSALERGNLPIQNDDQSLKTIYNRYGEAKKCELVSLFSRLPETERLTRLKGFLKHFGNPLELHFN